MPVRKTKLYLETSVFGFYFDEREINRYKCEATRRLFEQIHLGFFEGHTGAVTILELERTKDVTLKESIFKLLNDFYVQVLKLNENEKDEIQKLAKEFMTRGAIPNDKVDDAVHLATMVVRPELQILVTWNCRHIANINVERKIKVITIDNGYEFNFRILTPEEIVIYEK